MTNTPLIEPGTRLFVGDRYFIAPHEDHWTVWDSQDPGALKPIEAFHSLSAARLSAGAMEQEAARSSHETKEDSDGLV